MDKKYIEAVLKVIADETSAVAALIDTKDDYRIIWVNEPLRKHLGFAPEGMRWGGRCPFAYGVNAVEALDEAVETGETYNAEEKPFGARVSSRFGETTYWNWKSIPLDTEDCPGCVLFLAENVTDHVARKAAGHKREAVFAGVVLDLPIGVAVIDPEDCHLVDANDTFLSYLLPEYQTRESIGKLMADIMPVFESSGFAGVLRATASSHELFASDEYEMVDPTRGSTWWNLAIRPVSTEEDHTLLLVTAWDVSDQVNTRRRLEKSRQRAQALTKVQQAISASLALEEVLNLISQSARELMNSSAASVFLLSDDKQVFTPKGASGIDLIGTCAVSVGRAHSLAERAILNGHPVTLSGQSVAELSCLPVLESGKSIKVIAAAPITVETEAIGVIEVYDDKPHRYSNDELETLDNLANTSATAIVNASLYEEAENSRRELESQYTALDNERKLLITVLDSMPDAVAVTDANNNIIRANEATMSLFTSDERNVLSFETLVASGNPRTLDGHKMLPEEHPMARVLKGEEIRNYEFTLDGENGELNYRSVSGSPVRDKKGKIIYGVTIGRDITVQKKLQAQLEAAYERERRIAQTLQQALLSPVPRVMDGIRAAVIYEAGLREAEIGGDFFDFFNPCPGKLAIVIGDVAGKGLNAAIQIAAVKYGIRGFAYEDPSPSIVAARTNDFMVRERTVGGFVSVFYGLIDVNTKILTYTNAGHEPPLLRGADGSVQRLLSNGIVMGVTSGYEYEERTIELKQDARLLLYTDGISEARKESGEMLGEERLIDFWAGACGDDAETALNSVYNWAKEFSEGHFHDDVALMVISTEEGE